MGVCSGIADYTGLDVTLVRIMFLGAVFMSGGSVLPLYFIAGFVADDKPRELRLDDQGGVQPLLARRSMAADPYGARHSQPAARYRPATGRYRKAMSPWRTAASPARSSSYATGRTTNRENEVGRTSWIPRMSC